MKLFGTEEINIPVNGGSVPCVTFGKGSRNLVMIPGLRTSSIKGTALFCRLYYSCFAKNYRVYIIDRKNIIPECCTIHDIAEDTFTAAKTLGIKNAYLLGISQGGMVAQDIMINHSGFANAAVLAVTLSRTNKTVTAAVNTWVNLIKNNDLYGFAADYTRRGYSAKYRRKYGKILPLVFRLQKMMPADRFVTLAKACLTCDTYDRLYEIKCPVLVIGAERDKVVSGKASVELARKIIHNGGSCRCHMYKNLSHEAYNEAKDFNRRVLDFFEGINK